MTRAELIATYPDHRWLPDGSFAGVAALLGGRGRINISSPMELDSVASFC
jgi:hypothetical protein